MISKTSFLQHFTQQYGINRETLRDDDVEAICLLEAAHNLLASDENIEHLVDDPMWGVLHSMLERAEEFALGSLTLLATKQNIASEVVARTVVESAVNIIYVIMGDPLERLMSYLVDYIETEREENKKWSNAILNLSANAQKIQKEAMEQKRKALDFAETIILDSASQAGKNLKTFPKWPNIRDRFKAIQRELDYRTIYAAMCTQTHNGAEDLLNKLIIFSLGNEKLEQELLIETTNFSRLLVYSGIEYYLDSCIVFTILFHLVEAETQLKTAHNQLEKLRDSIR